jgi:flavin reductase (DIM6/NTAB) family NADH-FMN oxidoreductase RutF
MLVDPGQTPIPKLHSLLLGAVIPRPIAFVSSIDSEGKVNLSPFSFFNVFSSNPPVMVFSPSRRGRDKSHKHTYENVKQISEVVINMVSYSMVEQASLASGEFPRGVSEFIKAGFTEEPSVMVKPPRVHESPVSFECKVKQVIELGEGGSAGNLVICEMLLMRIKDEVLDENGRIDPVKLDAVARMGQEYYCRVIPKSIFAIPRPGEKPGIGFEALPEWLRNHPAFTTNDLARMAGIAQLPQPDDVRLFEKDSEFESLRKNGKTIAQIVLHYLQSGNVESAWKVILLPQS